MRQQKLGIVCSMSCVLLLFSAASALAHYRRGEIGWLCRTGGDPMSIKASATLNSRSVLTIGSGTSFEVMGSGFYTGNSGGPYHSWVPVRYGRAYGYLSTAFVCVSHHSRG